MMRNFTIYHDGHTETFEVAAEVLGEILSPEGSEIVARPVKRLKVPMDPGPLSARGRAGETLPYRCFSAADAIRFGRRNRYGLVWRPTPWPTRRPLAVVLAELVSAANREEADPCE